MDIKEVSYTDLTVKALTLLDTDDKVRCFLMESTRIMRALSLSDAIYTHERRTFKRNYWRFILCCNLTQSINRITAMKIYVRFVGGYCEGLELKTAQIMGMLFEELAESIHRDELKEQEILNNAINYLLKY